MHTTSCKCGIKESCQLGWECLQNNVVYRCKVKDSNDTNELNYIGLRENIYKDGFYKHINSFKYESWDRKDNDSTPVMKWSIPVKENPYTNGSKRCQLCLTEKYHIIYI